MNHLRSVTQLFRYVLTPGLLILGLLGWSTAFAQFQADYKMVQIGRIIQVGANGTPTENATDLEAALTKAQALTPTATNPVTVYLGPGLFDFGTMVTAITMPDQVHLHGSGAGVTTIECDCSNSIYVNGTTNQFSHLTVRNSSGSYYAILAESSAHVVISDAVTMASAGVEFETASTGKIYNSTLSSGSGGMMRLLLLAGRK